MDDMEAVLSPSRRRALAGAALLAVVLVLAARYVAQSGAPAASRPPERVTLARAPAAPELLVHVVGAVRRPGLYRLKEGARVADALERAGGPAAKADLALVNLAAPVADGTQVLVPRRGAAPASGGSAGAAGGPVQLNSATVEQLDSLPGIGPVTAERIVEYRQAHGAFRSVEELDAVPGIGPARVEQLKEVVTP
jgi:competence protein ComEA